MSEQINSKITKNISMLLVTLLSFFQFSQVFAGLEEEEVYIKDNITVVLTGSSIFTNEWCTNDATSYNCDEYIALYNAQSSPKDTPLIVVVAPSFWDVGTQGSNYHDMLVTAVRNLGLPKIPIDLNKTDEWSINPGILDNSFNRQKMHSSGFYVKQAAVNSAFVNKFGTTSTYVGFANIRSNTLSQDEMDNLDAPYNSDMKYIKEGKSYTNIKQGLSKLLSDNPNVTKLHVYLPVLHYSKISPQLGNIAAKAFCDKFIENINDKIKISSIIYVDLLHGSDITIRHIQKSLTNYGFNKV
ncbi:MAG: hypothetical protein QS748_08410 [Candidatus Endonucleobacter bathymodioli]|uniref:Uncharacterized protein n=1 Tax=Candidatus Endonucleibacter bathymodioli TaxID=539814 RepID=A0AA90SDD7_9GAMM|nr:hypothetical protein [Candidatus Endonucleobacter bathymodioli]MDP0589199.1 hypothetical protein [Candidatus Endonucleobacter bathymodioli]